MALREAHREPSPRTRIEACWPLRAARQPLALRFHHDEHARRFKADLLTDDRLKNATLQKFWAMLARPCVAVDGGLLDANPFSRVKLRLGDDSACEVQTR